MNNAIDNTVTELTLEQAAAEAKSFKSKLGGHLSVNKSGNIFVRYPQFQAWSVDKEKSYTAGLNIDAEILKEICSNKFIQNEILEFLALVPSRVGMTADDVQELVRLYKKEKKS